MNNLTIEATNTTPFVAFDAQKHTLILEGDSRPENVDQFYDPIIRWVQQYCDYLIDSKSSENVTIHIKLNYYNSSSSKCIYDLLEHTKVLNDESISVNVVWSYEKDDDDMREAGQDLQELLHINFTYKEI